MHKSWQGIRRNACAACGGQGFRVKWSDRRNYRYHVQIYHETYPGERGADGGMISAGLKYTVARNPANVSYEGPEAENVLNEHTQHLTSCGRFAVSAPYGRTFVSDREADRTVERLASGMPVFVTRGIAIAATIGLALPAWISALVVLFDSM